MTPKEQIYMREPLNPEKSKKLRPLRIVLAVLIAVLIVLVLDRLPTSVKNRPTEQETTSGSPAPEGSSYYYFYDMLDILEDQTEERLKVLGVPEEEYENIDEYLSNEEITELEAKVVLSTSMESAYTLANEADIVKIQEIFDLSHEQIVDKYERPSSTPSEYKNLSDLLTDFYNAINSADDDEIVE